jgi:hypothetical protein
VFRCRRARPLHPSFVTPHSNGFTTGTPALAKSRLLRVATVRPWANAVAAIMLSLTGIASPAARSLARSVAQRSPVVASHGRHDDASDASLKPAFELLPSLAFRQKQDTELDLADKEPLLRAGEKPVHQSFVRAWSPAHEAIFTAVQPFDLKLLSRFNAILPANLRRKDDLAFAGNTRCHAM